jgi:salicylate hydroxylase
MVASPSSQNPASNDPLRLKSRQLIISGGGIGGLTAALCLVRRGWLVTVLEQNETPQEFGAGIQLSPNANSVFDELGLLDQIGQSASAPPAVELRRAKNNKLLARMDVQAHALRKFKQPYYVIHRSALHKFLWQQAVACDQITLLSGHQTVDLANYQTGVTAMSLSNGVYHEHGGRALICAEGIWSPTRNLIFPDLQAQHTGKIAWRCLIDENQANAETRIDRNTIAWLARKSHLVCYPLKPSGQVNLVAFSNGDEAEKHWSVPAAHQDLEEIFKHWSPAIRQTIAAADNWTRWPVYALKKKSDWVKGNVALIGDAAHAMEPFLAQGAAAAIEDAAVIASVLHPEQDTAASLQQWQSLRQPRVRKIARRAHEAGDIYHFGFGLATMRNVALKAMPAGNLLNRYDWINGWQSPPIPQDYNRIFLQ